MNANQYRVLGYSSRIIKLNKEASGRLLGVKLGRVCIKHDIPVTYVAGILKVSRQTVYNWFTGATNPHDNITDTVKKLIIKLSS